MPPKKNPATQTQGATGDDKTPEKNPAEDGGDFEERMRQLEDEEKLLEQRLQLAEKQKKIATMKAKLQSLEKACTDPTACTAGATAGTSGVSLGELRAMEGLQRQVDEGLVDLTGEAQEGDENAGIDNNILNAQSLSKTKVSSTMKSGKEAKTTDNVKCTLKWPHTAVKYNVGQKQAAYSELDFASLVAGEISVINSADTPVVEKYGRLELLKTTAYHSRTFQWQDVLNFHGTCLLEIEKGERTWGGRETFLTVEASTLYAQPIKATNTWQSDKPSEGRRWFCKPFQTGKCKHNGSHEAMVQGRVRRVDHICATCLQKDRAVMSHAETSPDCPHHDRQ